MGLLCCVTVEGTGQIVTGEVTTPFADAAGRWVMWDRGLARLWQPPPNRGQSRPIPLMDGRRATRRRWDERTVRCDMTFAGAGTDPVRSLREAVDEFYDAAVVRLTTGDGTRTLTVTSADGTRSRTGPVTVEALTETADASVYGGEAFQDYELVLTIPSGRLALVP